MKRGFPNITVRTVSLTVASVLTVAAFLTRSGLAQPTPEGRQQMSQDTSIEQTKAKGFEGVDFYYDVFGAMPGQDPQKTAQQVMKKDVAEKPEVMTKQRKLLEERYDLS